MATPQTEPPAGEPCWSMTAKLFGNHNLILNSRNRGTGFVLTPLNEPTEIEIAHAVEMIAGAPRLARALRRLLDAEKAATRADHAPAPTEALREAELLAEAVLWEVQS